MTHEVIVSHTLAEVQCINVPPPATKCRPLLELSETLKIVDDLLCSPLFFFFAPWRDFATAPPPGPPDFFNPHNFWPSTAAKLGEGKVFRGMKSDFVVCLLNIYSICPKVKGARTVGVAGAVVTPLLSHSVDNVRGDESK